MHPEVKDVFKRVIEPGDLVTYPVRSTSRMWVEKMTVTHTVQTPRGAAVCGINANNRRVRVWNTSNLVIVFRGVSKCPSMDTIAQLVATDSNNSKESTTANPENVLSAGSSD